MNHVTRIGSDLHTLAADEPLLDLALEGADIAPLLMVLVHLTGEEHWLDEVGPYINGPWNFQATVAGGVGGPVPEEYLPMILEEMMLDDNDPKTVRWRTRPNDETLAAFRVVI